MEKKQDKDLIQFLRQRYQIEDRANGYATGDYKKRHNMIGIYQTTHPEHVAKEIKKPAAMVSGAESIPFCTSRISCTLRKHIPFQDGNGRTGRIILFKECLKKEILPAIIEDSNRMEYLESLKQYREEKDSTRLAALFDR